MTAHDAHSPTPRSGGRPSGGRPSGTHARDGGGAARNAAVVRRFIREAINERRDDLIDTLVDPAHVLHCSDGDLYGPAGVRLDLAEKRSAIPDLTFEEIDLLAAGDRVAVRWRLRGTHVGPLHGIAPTGTSAEVPGMMIARLTGGRLAETWVTVDLSSLVHRSIWLADRGRVGSPPPSSSATSAPRTASTTSRRSSRRTG